MTRSARISVIIATHNGAGTLVPVLEGLERLKQDYENWELIIVDNASTDETPAILGSHKDKLPLTILFCDQPGKNRALNMAVPHATGDIIVFSDDDAIPATNWLSQIAEIAAKRPGFDIFGGRIEPRWPQEPPAWLDRIDSGAVFVITPHDASTGESPSGANIWGPNMAVRRSVFDAGHRFDETIGPAANQPNYRMGSETELVERLCALGHRCWFDLSWKVAHQIRQQQLEKDWVLARAFRFGRGTYRGAGKATPTIGPVPRWMIFRGIVLRLKAIGYLLSRNANQRFSTRFQIRFLDGMICEARLSNQQKRRHETLSGSN